MNIVQLEKPEQNNDNVKLEKFNIEISPIAIKQMIMSCVGDEENRTTIRIGVKGAGCLGFQYNLEHIKEEQIDTEEDLVEEVQNIKLVMDIFSKEYLKGTTIDFVSSLQETGFKFINPLVKKECGCSKSFSV